MSVPAGPSMQQAFEAAKVEHSEKPEQAVAPEASTAKTDPVPPAQHTEQAAGAPSVTADASDLISDADWAALQETFKGDSAKQRAELNRVFTQKTQALAAERKRLARAEPHLDLLDAYETDPAGTIRQLAEQHGLVFAPAVEKPAPDAATDRFLSLAKTKLGPDLDFLAAPMAAMLSEVTAPLLTELESLKSQTTTIVSKATNAEVDGHLAAFEKAHPDWKDHEPAMLKLGLMPGAHMSAGDYLEACYKLVTFDSQVDKAKADAVTKLSKAAEAAEKETQTVPGKQVQLTAPKGATMRDAFAAAKRDERWA